MQGSTAPRLSGSVVYPASPIHNFCEEPRKAANGLLSITQDTYTYDFATGKPLSKTDGNGHTTGWERDKLGRVTKEILPDGAVRLT